MRSKRKKVFPCYNVLRATLVRLLAGESGGTAGLCLTLRARRHEKPAGETEELLALSASSLPRFVLGRN